MDLAESIELVGLLFRDLEGRRFTGQATIHLNFREGGIMESNLVLTQSMASLKKSPKLTVTLPKENTG